MGRGEGEREEGGEEGGEGHGGHWRKEMRSVERKDATPGGLKRMVMCRDKLPLQSN